MRILLAGATGFIGGHLLRGLLRRGHAVTALVRPGRPAPEGSRALEGNWLEPGSWVGALAGHDAFVNAVGLIRERPDAGFEAVQAEVPVRVFQAAARLGVGRVVQVSALGAVDGAPTRFLATKRAADRWLERSGIHHLVLRPSLVYGPGDHSMALLARLARLPVVPLPDGGTMRVQPLHVGDLVRAVGAWLEGAPSGSYDLGGGEALTLRELLGRLRGRRPPFLPIPAPLMALAARATDLMGKGPVTTDELRMLRAGSTCDNGPFIRAFGFAPLPFTLGLPLREAAALREDP